MISKELAKYSLKNLWKQKGRSALTTFSILIGITAIFIFLSFGLGLFAYVNSFLTESSADKVSITPKGGAIPGLDDTFALTPEDLKVIERTSGVFEASPMVQKIVEIKQRQTKKYTFLVGFEPDEKIIEEFANIEIYKGRQLRNNDQGNVVLGYNYMFDNKIFPKGLDLNDIITINGESLRVVGFYESLGNPQDDAAIYMNLDYLDKFYATSNNYSMIIARVDPENIDTIVDRIEKNLRNSKGQEEGEEDFYVASFTDLFETYTSSLNIIVGFVILIALVSVIVSAINTANTMITSVLERIKEIGVIKSIGARNSEIFNIFLFESSFLGFVGGVFGSVLGFIITYIAGRILVAFDLGFLQPAYPWYLFAGCILFATITGGISGVLPAINASKIKPVDALRYE